MLEVLHHAGGRSLEEQLEGALPQGPRPRAVLREALRCSLRLVVRQSPARSPATFRDASGAGDGEGAEVHVAASVGALAGHEVEAEASAAARVEGAHEALLQRGPVDAPRCRGARRDGEDGDAQRCRQGEAARGVPLGRRRGGRRARRLEPRGGDLRELELAAELAEGPLEGFQVHAQAVVRLQPEVPAVEDATELALHVLGHLFHARVQGEDDLRIRPRAGVELGLLRIILLHLPLSKPLARVHDVLGT
mmetsp:Transcript_76719/g.215264  ORF Transcript_76719/g.215264 Transcript_76719/m.215264 type:complete len:250 (-) Transcript_76719:191-940(-)